MGVLNKYENSWDAGWCAADMYVRRGMSQKPIGVRVGESGLYIVYGLAVFGTAAFTQIAIQNFGWDLSVTGVALCMSGLVMVLIGVIKNMGGQKNDEK